MRRRDFLHLAAGAVLAGSLRARFGYAQDADAGDRAAVVIGVNRPGSLPILNAAVSGAEEIGTWLAAQQFDVQTFVDTNRPVVAHDVKAAVTEIVNRGTVSQLVVYFAGHGFVSAYSELWLLSGAPDDVDEAIVLAESVDLARQTGIPNVVFISDACRSTADSLGTSRVRGSVVFPNGRAHPNVTTDVDRLLATQIGDPAFEVAVKDSVKNFQGVFTTSFLEAFKHPAGDMVLAVEGAKVVPSRRLRTFLLRDVPKRAAASAITLSQVPSCIVESDEPTYIGRVSGDQTASAAPGSPTSTSNAPQPSAAPAAPGPSASAPPPITLNDVAAHTFAHALRRAPPHRTASRTVEVEATAARSGFARTQARIRAAPSTADFKTNMGFTVIGATVRRAVTSRGLVAEILRAGEGTSPALVQIAPGRDPQGSVALQFADGSGTVLAALRDFVGHVLVEQAGVTNTSYVPAMGSPRWPDYRAQSGEIDDVRAAVATAAKHGALAPDDDDINHRIDALKGLDPTLGLYAAYASAQAGRRDEVQSVYLAMREGVGAELFDLALLADRISTEARAAGQLVPFCPMLSQGWNLLRIKAVELPPALAAARSHFRPALWTTFDEGGMTQLLNSDIWR